MASTSRTLVGPIECLLLRERQLAYGSRNTVAALQDEQAEGNIVGIDLTTGEPMDPVSAGVYDSFRVLRNSIASASGIASNLLLCDELLKARQMSAKAPGVVDE